MRAKRDYSIPLPARIRELREENKKSQADLGKALGVTKSNIGSYETGKIIPPADKIVALAKYFNVSTDYLLGASDAKTDNITEETICDYIGLDIDTVRHLHQTKDDSAQHLAIDFFIQDEELLDTFEKHAWANGTEIVKSTRYSLLPFFDEMLYKQKDKVQLSFANIVHAVDLLPDKFRKYFENNKIKAEKGIMKYCSEHVDVITALDLLSRIDPESQFIKTLFPSFDSKMREAYPEDLIHYFEDSSYRENTHLFQVLSSADADLLYSFGSRKVLRYMYCTRKPRFLSSADFEKILDDDEYKDIFVQAATELLLFLTERLTKADGDEA